MEVVLSSNTNIADSTSGPMKKCFIWGGHLACGGTGKLSAEEGTHLRGKLKKINKNKNKVGVKDRLRGNCLAQDTHKGKRTPLGG